VTPQAQNTGNKSSRHRHGVAIVGLGDVLDADQLGLAVSPLDEGWSSSQAYRLPAISEVHFAGTNKI
jgi:hypothetical protein